MNDDVFGNFIDDSGKQHFILGEGQEDFMELKFQQEYMATQFFLSRDEIHDKLIREICTVDIIPDVANIIIEYMSLPCAVTYLVLSEGHDDDTCSTDNGETREPEFVTEYGYFTIKDIQKVETPNAETPNAETPNAETPNGTSLDFTRKGCHLNKEYYCMCNPETSIRKYQFAYAKFSSDVNVFENIHEKIRFFQEINSVYIASYEDDQEIWFWNEK